MDHTEDSYRIERVLNEKSPESFFEAEAILEDQEYSFNLVGTQKLEKDEEKQDVFIYELEDEQSNAFFLYEFEGNVYSKVLDSTEDEPSI